MPCSSGGRCSSAAGRNRRCCTWSCSPRTASPASSWRCTSSAAGWRAEGWSSISRAMSTSPNAVFLSHASQDNEAAQRICEALRARGIEVWFDQSELRGGDAWDQKLRRQIKECRIFMPLISANTNARAEGYFRLEWKLAVDRSHLMADDEPFLFPVAIDGLPDAEARVPDRFREVQWARLGAKDSFDSIAARVVKLL